MGLLELVIESLDSGLGPNRLRCRETGSRTASDGSSIDHIIRLSGNGTGKSTYNYGPNPDTKGGEQHDALKRLLFPERKRLPSHKSKKKISLEPDGRGDDI